MLGWRIQQRPIKEFLPSPEHARKTRAASSVDERKTTILRVKAEIIIRKYISPRKPHLTLASWFLIAMVSFVHVLLCWFDKRHWLLDWYLGCSTISFAGFCMERGVHSYSVVNSYLYGKRERQVPAARQCADEHYPLTNDIPLPSTKSKKEEA